jgi:molybdopterin converting factor small subunit
MLYDAKQLAEMFKVSDVTIYAKLKLKSLAPFIVTKDRKRYVTEGALPVLNGLLNPASSVKSEPDTKPEKTHSDKEYEVLSDLVKSLKSEVEFLRSQLETRDRLMEGNNQLMQNMQYLLKEQKAIEPPKEPLIRRLLGKKKTPV